MAKIEYAFIVVVMTNVTVKLSVNEIVSVISDKDGYTLNAGAIVARVYDDDCMINETIGDNIYNLIPTYQARWKIESGMSEYVGRGTLKEAMEIIKERLLD